jgi:hypothetical protein
VIWPCVIGKVVTNVSKELAHYTLKMQAAGSSAILTTTYKTSVITQNDTI